MQEENHIYYNLFKKGNEQFANTQIEACNFNDYRKSPILYDPSKYYCSIIRFSLNTSTIPLFIYPNIANSNGTRTVDNTLYSVALVFNSTTFSQNVIFTSRNNDYNSNDENFYYIDSYQSFVDMINTAYQTAFTNMKTTYPAAQPTESPYITYDSTTKLFSLFAQQSYATIGNITRVHMNLPLFNYFQSWDVKYRDVNLTDSTYVEILVKNNKNNIPASPVSYYEMKQENSTLANWSIFQAIVIVSYSLPIKSEIVPNQTDNSTNQITDNRMNILVDFEPNFDIGYQSSFIQYVPRSEYKLIDMGNSSSINYLSINVMWRDTNQIIRPVYLNPYNSFCSIKLMFRNKKYLKQ